MIRVTKEEWNKVLQNIKKDGVELRACGGGISGNYSVWLEDKKIAFHQFEYENYYELDKDYYEKYKN